MSGSPGSCKGCPDVRMPPVQGENATGTLSNLAVGVTAGKGMAGSLNLLSVP